MKRFLIFLTLALGSSLYAQQDIETSFEVAEQAANRFIMREYNSNDFAFSGTSEGHTYSLQMGRPEVRFSQNYMHMTATLTAQTDIGNFTWTITPSIYVNYSVSLDDLKALLTAFDIWVRSNLLDAPTWLQDVIIMHYENLELTMYPSKVLDYATAFVPDYLDIEVTDIDDLSIVAQSEKLIVNIKISVIGREPIFTVETYNQTKLRVSSPVKITIKNISIKSGGLIWEDNTDRQIEKNGSYTYTFNLSQAILVGGRTIKIFFESPYNQYVRVYDLVEWLNDNTWTERVNLSSYNIN
jgi:hypothetical protein